MLNISKAQTGVI